MRIKQRYFVFLAMMLFWVFSSISVSANEKTTEDGWSYTIYDISGEKYVGLKGYTGQEETLVIPEVIDNIPVTTMMGLENFQYPEKIKKIVISKNIESADYLTFEKLSSLEAIEVSKENSKFYSEDGILFSKYKKTIRLEFYPCAKQGDSYTISSNVNSLTMAFLNNQYLKTLNIDAKVDSVFEYFNGSNIETIVLPDSIKYIGEYAFKGCAKLKKIEFGDRVKTIAREAFDGCDSLKTITIPDSVNTVDKYAFDGYSGKIKKASYLKKQKDGSYIAKAKIGKKEYKATTITKIVPAKKSYTVKQGKTTKLKTMAYVNKKKKGALSTTSMLSYKSSNKKVLKISKYGNMKGIKKGKATVTVRLKTGDISYKVKVTVK